MIHTMLYRFFRIWSYWTKSHFKLVKLMNVFKSNGCHENFMNICFKAFLNKKHTIQKQ